MNIINAETAAAIAQIPEDLTGQIELIGKTIEKVAAIGWTALNWGLVKSDKFHMEYDEKLQKMKPFFEKLGYRVERKFDLNPKGESVIFWAIKWGGDLK